MSQPTAKYCRQAIPDYSSPQLHLEGGRQKMTGFMKLLGIVIGILLLVLLIASEN